MCISCEIPDKYPPLIEFIIWFLLQGVNIGNHFGVWVLLQSNLIDITPPSYHNITVLINSTNVNVTESTQIAGYLPTPNTIFEINNNGSINATMTVQNKLPEEIWKKLIDFRNILMAFCCIGAAIFIIHILLLLPNVIQSFRVKDPASLKETGNAYFRNVLKIHCTCLVIETIFFDIPAGCLVMEILSLIWEGTLSVAQNMQITKDILAMSLCGLGFIAMYKGMMPLYLWIGNPFCFPCIPLRLLVVFPGGLIVMVMTFGPMMAVIKNRLLQFAPPVMQAEIGNMANSFFSIGIIFWAMFLIIGSLTLMCWYKYCRPGAKGEICDICCDT